MTALFATIPVMVLAIGVAVLPLVAALRRERHLDDLLAPRRSAPGDTLPLAA